MDDEILPYSSIDLVVGEQFAALTAMCYGVRLHIEVSSKDLLAEERQQYATFVETIDEEPEVIPDFGDWLVRPCQPHIQHLASPHSRTSKLSLQSYFHATTIFFILDSKNGQLNATRLPDSTSKTSHLIPAIPIFNGTASSAVQQGIPCIPASQLMIVREPGLTAWDYYEIPKFVYRIGAEKQQFYFKPAVDSDSFVREVEALMRMEHISHVTRLAGLVLWDDGLSIGGFILENIPNAKTLDWIMETSTKDDRMRWMSQICHTVRELHDSHIIWGDVKPQNVLVDSASHAWVVDFGGGFSLPWVDKEYEGTKEGDLRGLDAISAFLGL